MNKRKIEDDKRSRDFFEGLFVALIAALIIRQFIVQAYRIPTSSMEDTLLIGDFLLVNKFNYGMRTPDWIGIPYRQIFHDHILPKSRRSRSRRKWRSIPDGFSTSLRLHPLYNLHCHKFHEIWAS